MITVIGLGFVGLTTALGFSKFGFKVYGIENNSEKINNLKSYKIPFYEPYLEEVLREQLNSSFFLDKSLKKALQKSKVVFICVGTPSNENGSADLTFLLNAVKSVISISNDSPKTIVIKSTVPPSTISKIVQPFVKKHAKNPENFSIASNPEFLREGTSWEDFVKPDRIVAGVSDQRAKEMLQEVYSPFKAPLHFVSTNSAEFIKYLSNSLLSTLISFSNEMSMIADHIGDIDVRSAFKILHQDKRWDGKPAPMRNYVFPGCGYGGYCLPKDTAALANIARQNGFLPKILDANLEVNNNIQNHLVNKIINNSSPQAKIGVLGLSFKAGSDDVRESPSFYIIKKLLDKGYKNIYAFDPMANSAFDKQFKLPIHYLNSFEEIIEETEHIVILTGWPEFSKTEDIYKNKTVFDFRYILKKRFQRSIHA
jgi:UDPglucose 6-dehydrogenase